MVGTFGQKPSKSHVVWASRENSPESKKRFDFDYLRRWAQEYAIEYETRTRVDHDRGGESREQHLVVFAWTETEGTTFEMGDTSWDIQAKDTPQTFLEIDEQGVARIKTWEGEGVFDVQEMWLDGPAVEMRTAESGERTLETQKLLDKEGEAKF